MCPVCSGHGGGPTEGQTLGSEDILHAAQHQAQEQCCYGDEGVPGAPAWYGNIIFLLRLQECAALTNSSPSKLKCSLPLPDPLPNRCAGKGSGDLPIPNLFCRNVVLPNNVVLPSGC